MRLIVLPLLTTLALVAPGKLRATLVMADFNDLTAGVAQGQGGGTGFSSNYANTGTINVIGGDLTPDASTHYCIVTTGTPQSLQGRWSSGRQLNRNLTNPLVAGGGTVWFSYLLNQPLAESRGGIGFNQGGFSPGNPRIVSVGDELRIGLGGTLQPAGGGVAMGGLGQTHLVVGRLIVDPTAGAETIDVWINPDVAAGSTNLGAPDNSLSVNDAGLSANGVTSLAFSSYDTSTTANFDGGILDNVILSDTATTGGLHPDQQAFFEVTGKIPEPSRAVLISFGLGALLLRRRRGFIGSGSAS